MLPSDAYVVASMSPDYKFDTPGQHHIPVGKELFLAVTGIERYYMGRDFRRLLLLKHDSSDAEKSEEGKSGYEVFSRVGYAELRDLEIWRGMKNDQYQYPGDKSSRLLIGEIWDYNRKTFVLI
jgi:hypothetical protein